MTIHYRKILVVGHPRAGTGYTSALLKQFSLDVGHEADGVDGVSSWMMAVDAQENPWAADPVAVRRGDLKWDTCLLPVRDPITAAPSIIRENRHAPISYKFRRAHIMTETGFDLQSCRTELECALQSLLYWTAIIENTNPDFWFRIEDGELALFDFLTNRGLRPKYPVEGINRNKVNADKLYLGKHYPKPVIQRADWHILPSELRDRISNYCIRYGYKDPCD